MQEKTDIYNRLLKGQAALSGGGCVNWLCDIVETCFVYHPVKRLETGGRYQHLVAAKALAAAQVYSSSVGVNRTNHCFSNMQFWPPHRECMFIVLGKHEIAQYEMAVHCMISDSFFESLSEERGATPLSSPKHYLSSRKNLIY